MKPFFSKEIRFKILMMVSVILLLSVLEVYLAVAYNKWEVSFYNAIQVYDKTGFLHALVKGTFLILATISVLLLSFSLQSFVEMKCRKWMTDFFINKWFINKAYYQIKLQNCDIANPDQRISQDIEEFTSITLSLLLGGFSSLLNLSSFLVILWGLSGQFKFNIYHHSFYIPGYMVWVALIYSGLSTFITFKIGRPLTRLTYQKETYEAEFRYNLIRVTEYSDHIACYSGEQAEQNILNNNFNNIFDNFKITLKQKIKINMFNFFYFQISSLFPTLIAASRYFAKEITLGNMMQIKSAFSSVQGSISFFIYSYIDIAILQAVIDRLYKFHNALDNVHILNQETHNHNNLNLYLSVKDLKITMPNNKVLIDNFSIDCYSGDSILILGPSGFGKTTLLKTFSGIWPFFEGKISKQGFLSSLFIAQRTYIPNSSLRNILCYPKVYDLPDDDLIISILLACGLPNLTHKLDIIKDFNKILSVGELQKISFCRILINKPDIIYLDEATSALDENNEKVLYQKIIETLPNSVIISTGHRDSLRLFHNKIVELSKEI